MHFRWLRPPGYPPARLMVSIEEAMIDHVKIAASDRNFDADDLRLPAAAPNAGMTTRRYLLRVAGLASLGLGLPPAWADTVMQFSPPLPSGPNERTLTTTYPTKGPMILQRSRPPLLETPFDVFDKGVFTPNDQFFVRWHWAKHSRRSGRRHLPPHAARAREPDIVAVLARASDHAACGRSRRQSMLGQFARLFSSHGCLAASGAMAPWATPAGPACD